MTTSTASRRVPGPARSAANLSWALFCAAIGLIAVHVIDDSFVQPQPGTSAGDHVFGGLILLAILALAAWGYPRVRAGARAAIALSLVVPAVLSGAEAIYYAGKTGLAGDDYTGMLAMVAAPVLLGLGIWNLWTSRRLGDNLARRYGRRLLKFVAVFVGAFIVVVPLSISYIGSHVSRAEVPDAELGAAHENVTLETSDGLELEGWYVPSRNRAAVIVFPGRTGAQKQARMLVRHGYGVLLYDRRGEGASDGDPHAFGWSFDEDIKAGVAFLKGRADVERGRIGGLGLSVGGEMMLQTAAGTKELAAVVSDGAGSRIAAEEIADLAGTQRLINAPMFLANTAAIAMFSNHAPPKSLTHYIPRIAPRPIMLIHAARGEVGNKTPEYLAAARGPAHEWTVPKGGHTAGIRTMPREYERRVVGFFDRALRARGR
jgi:dienelactone hydrolase